MPAGTVEQCVKDLEDLDLKDESEEIVKLSNQEVFDVLHECDNYAKNQLILMRNLSDGIFNISKSRKYGSAVTTVDNIRDEFDASVLVEQVHENGDYDLIELEGEPITLFCGLPPPTLRKAQKDFKEALGVALKLAKIVQNLQNALQTVDE